VITYTGSYDDMVWQRRKCGPDRGGNAQREKKIEQLQDFIARFAAGTRSSQVQSRKKEVERLQNGGTRQIQYSAPVHPLRCGGDLPAASGRNRKPREVVRWRKRQCRVFHDFIASVSRGEKIALIGRNGAGKLRF